MWLRALNPTQFTAVWVSKWRGRFWIFCSSHWSQQGLNSSTPALPFGKGLKYFWCFQATHTRNMWGGPTNMRANVQVSFSPLVLPTWIHPRVCHAFLGAKAPKRTDKTLPENLWSDSKWVRLSLNVYVWTYLLPILDQNENISNIHSKSKLFQSNSSLQTCSWHPTLELRTSEAQV